MIDRLLVWCKADDANLRRVLEIVVDEGSMMDGYEDRMEDIFVEALGERGECPSCGSLVLPGLRCWSCAGWTAPLVEGKSV